MSQRKDRPEHQRILVVDDECGIRDILRKILRRAGYDVDVADSGTTAIGLVKSSAYRLVLMDLKMPEMRGPEAIRRILSIRPETKILVLTGHIAPIGNKGDLDEIDRVVIGRHHSCVFKPFKNEEVVSTIRLLLDPANNQDTAAWPKKETRRADREQAERR